MSTLYIWIVILKPMSCIKSHLCVKIRLQILDYIVAENAGIKSVFEYMDIEISIFYCRNKKMSVVTLICKTPRSRSIFGV